MKLSPALCSLSGTNVWDACDWHMRSIVWGEFPIGILWVLQKNDKSHRVLPTLIGGEGYARVWVPGGRDRRGHFESVCHNCLVSCVFSTLSCARHILTPDIWMNGCNGTVVSPTSSLSLFLHFLLFCFRVTDLFLRILYFHLSSWMNFRMFNSQRSNHF